MKLIFLGTRGEIEARSRWHRRHSALLVVQGATRMMIDCGADWRHRLKTVAPDAILLTHAHPDHAAGLAEGASCPVYATAATWRTLPGLPIRDRHDVPLNKTLRLGELRLCAIPVRHSIRAPAVGYRVSARGTSCFYLPDVARLPNPRAALHRVDLYIGDGATVRRSMVRQKQGRPTGHASIIQQLDWCVRGGVRRAIFTHCGSGIVRARRAAADALIARLGCERGIEARLAHDGDSLVLCPRRRISSRRKRAAGRSLRRLASLATGGAD